jgi:hypothetical protein
METPTGSGARKAIHCGDRDSAFICRHRRQIPRRLASIEGFFRETIRICFVTAAHEID